MVSVSVAVVDVDDVDVDHGVVAVDNYFSDYDGDCIDIT